MYKYLLLILYLVPSLTLADMNAAMQALRNGDYTRAATELKPLAEQGNAVAQSHLGYLYYTGEGVSQSYEEAIKWYQKAAVQGNKDAQYNLAVAYAFGEGIKQDFKEAAIWYRRAADQGHAVAQYSLGLSYAYGEGVTQNEKTAAEWFMKSAENGYENAQVMVGSLYHTGDGVPKDYKKAVVWYRKAADRGNVIAQYNLGIIYRAGKGVEKNTDEAIKWFRLAADEGYEPAQSELSTMERTMAGAAHQPPATSPPVVEKNVQESVPEKTVTSTETNTAKEQITTSTPVTEAADKTTPAQSNKETATGTPQESVTEKVAGVSKTEPENVPESEPEPETEKSGGIFSRLKTLLASDNATEEAETPEIFVTPPREQVTVVKTPETRIEEKSSEPVVEETETKKPLINLKPRAPEKTSSIEELLSHQQAQAPQVEYQSPGNLTKTAPVSRAEINPEPATEPAPVALVEQKPEPEITAKTPVEKAIREPEPVPVQEENKKRETADNVSDVETTEQSVVENEEKSGGVLGFFGRMFSSEKTETVHAAEEQEIEKPSPVEEPPAAVAYSIDSKPGEHQLAAVDREDDSPEKVVENNIPDAEINSETTAPEITEQLTTAETTTVETEPEVIEPEETSGASGLGSFFGKLFGSDSDEQSVSINDSTASGPENETVLNNDSNTAESASSNSNEISEKQVEETLYLVKAEEQTTSPPVESKAEQDINKTTTPDPVETLKELAVSGEPYSQYELGKRYYEGDGLKQDYATAFIWYRRSALQGNAEAQYNLGTMYLMGEGTKQSDLEAADWYEKAAAQGHQAAKHNLENLKKVISETKTTESSPLANTESPETTRDMDQASATPVTAESHSGQVTSTPVNDKNPAESDFERGMAYTYGDGVPQNHNTAFKYFQSSALQGYAPAQYQMGIAYQNGYGVKADIQTALDWYEKSARQGHVMAQRTLGNIYLNGEGVNQNKPLALAWYSILAEKGSAIDVQRRDMLKDQLSSEEIRESELLRQQLSASLSTASITY